MTPNDQYVSDLTPQTNEEMTSSVEVTDQTSPDPVLEHAGNVGKSQTTDELMQAVLAKHGRNTGKTELTMFQMFLQTALAEVAEYNVLIKAAKTQAKRDYYQKKIKNVTKRLKRLLPA